MINKEQEKVVVDIIKGFKTHKAQLLAWYTGSGKTNIFLEVAARLVEKNPKVKIGISCYLHSNIKIQTSDRAEHFLKDHYVFSSRSRKYRDANVYLFNPQTIFKRKDFPHKFDYLILDEAHVGMTDSSVMMNIIIDKYTHNKTKFLGCSATPWPIASNYLFNDALVHKRGLDKGFLNDKRISDFNISIERFSIQTKSTDFNRSGELSDYFIRKNFEAIKLGCISKIKNMVKLHSNKIGNKCLIIVPPGNFGEIAKEVERTLGNSALSLVDENMLGSDVRQKDEESIINEFKNNKTIRYLIVINKCQIGFDMPELTSTIDLTITRNIGLLVQRWGRLARLKKDSNSKKTYFYVVDDSITPEETEWIIGTSVDFALGNWEAHKSDGSVRMRNTLMFGVSHGAREFDVDFSSMAHLYSNQRHLSTKTMSFSQQVSPMGTWSKDLLIAKAKEYKDRTELSEKNRYIYKKLKKFFPDQLEAIFPKKKKSWTIEECFEEMKKHISRRQFKFSAPSAHSRLESTPELRAEMSKYFDSVAHLLIKTHCPRGHKYTKENTILRPGRSGRECRSCANIRSREKNISKE